MVPSVLHSLQLQLQLHGVCSGRSRSPLSKKEGRVVVLLPLLFLHCSNRLRVSASVVSRSLFAAVR